jgi:molybdate transport system ATP-binding protein
VAAHVTAPLLAIRARRHVLDAVVDLDDSSTVTVLFGPSGAGKTTLLRCLAGLEPLDEGTIDFAGTRWSEGARMVVPARRRSVGYLFQDHALFPHLDVAANVAFGLRTLPRAERAARVEHALGAAHAGHLSSRPVPQLSGGEAQRVALARALAPQPALLLLDEPLSALDAATRASLRTELRQILVQQRIPTLVVTHDRSEALALGDRLVVLVDGRVRQVGTPVEVFDRPADQVVAGVVGVETAVTGTVLAVRDGVVQVEVAGRILTSALADDQSPDVGAAVVVCIRAEDVSLQSRRSDAVTSQRNQLDVTVTQVSVEGALVRVELDAGFRLSSYVTRPAREDLGIVDGARLVATFKGQAVHLVPR